MDYNYNINLNTGAPVNRAPVAQLKTNRSLLKCILLG